MEPEKSLFTFRPENRIIETRWATYWIMSEFGWRQFQVPFQSITGWKEPKIREAK
jgi:hypothetical protein